jgi:hypothetical protein
MTMPERQRPQLPVNSALLRSTTTHALRGGDISLHSYVELLQSPAGALGLGEGAGGEGLPELMGGLVFPTPPGEGGP